MFRAILFATVFLAPSIFWLGNCVSPCLAIASEDAPTPDAKRPVLYLHTEFLPYKTRVDKGITYRLGREIIRQAILMTARDEMGCATRDETLRETAPTNGPVVELMPIERADLHGKWNVKLVPYSTVKQPWEKTYDYVADGTLMYADMIPKLEADTHGVYVEALKLLGLHGKRPVPHDPQPPGSEIETLLSRVDFVSQYAAVRAAHQAIAAHGETPQWLGVLVRGYSNLAVLTAHYWNSSTEVFTARAWLYAQRMVALTDNSDAALWHRAYAWAFGGAMQHALADLAELKKRAGVAGQADEPAQRFAWTRVIKPFCQCDRTALQQVGTQYPACAPWAVRLRFQLATYHRQPRWMYQCMPRIRKLCPAAYGVYRTLCLHGHYLGLTRLGAAAGPMVFAEHIPQAVDAIPGLPKSIHALVGASTTDGGKPRGADESLFSKLPMTLARQLRQESREHPDADPSWSALASLIEEEQFIQVVDDLRDAGNATEHSLASTVDRLLPLVKDHPYAALIDAWRYDTYKQYQAKAKVLARISLRDPRRNMTYLFRIMWYIPDGHKIPMGQYAYKYYASRNFTLPGMYEYIMPMISQPKKVEARFVKMYAHELHAIAPNCDLGTFFEIVCAKAHEPDQLKHWEQQVRDDPKSFSLLGQYYALRGDTPSAIRCYRKSLDLVPSLSATILLSELYRKQEAWQQWETTLLDFLKTEDLGLEHGWAQERLANGYAVRGQWKKAKPYAVAFARTWAYGGLHLASWITEGLAQWEESERWIRAATQGYPSQHGFQWYFWCRRTGRGDLEKAQKIAASYFALQRRPSRENQVVLGTYRLLESDRRGALTAFRRALGFRPSYTCSFMVAQLARQLGDEKLYRDTIAAIQKYAIQLRVSGDPNTARLVAAGNAILQLMVAQDVVRDRLDQLDKLTAALDKNDPLTECAFLYFVGAELSTRGRKAEAEKYWRRALLIVPSDQDYATLAGFELAQRHGASRPDDDVRDRNDVWPPGTAKKK